MSAFLSRFEIETIGIGGKVIEALSREKTVTIGSGETYPDEGR